MKEELKKLRRKIHGFSVITHGLKPIRSVGVSVDLKDYNDESKTLFEVNGHREFINSPQIVNCYVSLSLAKAWLGHALGALGEETPYKNDGKRTEAAHIEPADDQVDVKAWEERNNWSSFNHIEKVDFIREQIKDILFSITAKATAIENQMFHTCMFNSANQLTEARFHLGFELERIKIAQPEKDIETFLYGGVTKK